MTQVKVVSVKFSREEFEVFKGVMNALGVTRSELVRALIAGILVLHGSGLKDEKISRATEKVFRTMSFDRYLESLASALPVTYVSGSDLGT